MLTLFIEGLRSLRGRIILSFIFIFCVLILWTLAFFYVNGQRMRIRENYDSLYLIQNSSLQSTEKLLNFMLVDYQNPQFYENAQYSGIDDFVKELNSNADSLMKVKAFAKDEMPAVVELIEQLELGMRSVADTAKAMRHIYFKRGFRDHGVEGQMRVYAHILQESSLIPEVEILSLRRHEKDFLLRNDKLYVDKFNQRAQNILDNCRENKHAYSVLVNYVNLFNELVLLSNQLGDMDGNGINGQVKRAQRELSKTFSSTLEVFSKELSIRNERFDLLLLAFSIGSILFLIFISIWLSGYLTKDVKALNHRIFAFINSRFTDDGSEFENLKKSGIREINQLNRMYDLMKTNLKETIADLETTVQKANQISEFKSFFLANMSHEIRTPLNGIIGMLHVLRSTDLSPKQLELLSTVDYSSNHLLELVNMVLDYSKIEAGKMELKPIAINLEKELRMLVQSFKPKIDEKNLKLEFSFEFDRNYFVIGDIVRLQQVLINLLNNAIKFSSKGVISFSVSQLNETETEQRLLFKIEDQGIGISEDKIEDIFKAFNQGDIRISRDYGGTGLGLAISNQIVKLMGGEISVVSKVGVGSVFSFTLNFPYGSLISEAKQMSNSGPENGQKLRVLVAEDNAVNQKVFELLFSTRNIDLCIAQNGRDAIDFFQSRTFDLVLLDLQMPILDGFETIAEIKRSSKYRMKTIGVYAVTANAFDEDRNRAKLAGFDGFISKPIILEELDQILYRYRRIVYDEESELR